MGPHLSTAISLSTGSPQGCVLSPLLYTLYTYDCTPTHHNISIVKFADDTTVVGFISGEDESAYREEVERLSVPRQQPAPEHHQDEGAGCGL